MHPGTVADFSWPDAAALLGILLAVTVLIVVAASAELRSRTSCTCS